MSNEPQDEASEKPRLGALGVVLGGGSWDASLAAVSDLEASGYSTIWVSGAQLDALDRSPMWRERLAAFASVRR